jgi:IS5 family transposase
VEVILRMLAVKRLYGLSYEQTEYQVRDSLVLRQFCRVYFNEVPDDTTLIRWAGLIQPETLERFQPAFDAAGNSTQGDQRAQAAHRWHRGGNQHPPSFRQQLVG